MRATARSCLVLVACAALVGAAFGSPKDRAAKPLKGGTFRIALYVNPGGIDSIDPALGGAPPRGMVLRATCAQLFAFPGPRPEVAAGYPKVSRDRRTYTFTIRKGFRFNTGEPLLARNYARAITRALSPTLRAEDWAYIAERILGGREFLEGKATTLPGVVARGRTLVLRLTRPWPQLLHDLANPPLFCPVPAALPIDPEGVGAPLPGSGPYYVSRYVPGREVVLVRNRLYRGSRPQHVDRFVVDLTNTFTTAAQQVSEGKADYALVAPTNLEELARRYGVNRTQFFEFIAGEASPRIIVLNSARPLFRNNPRLRRAVNFAVDRRALAATVGRNVAPTDQYLPPPAAGFRDVRIYPLRGDIRKARALARGHTRSGKAILYASELFPFIAAQTRLIQESLRRIGIDAEIKTFPHPVFLRRVLTPGEPFDLANSIGFVSGYPDHWVLNCMFHRRWIPPAEGGCNVFHYSSPRHNRLLDRAERLVGAARYRLYGRLDVELARDAAPGVPTVSTKVSVLVSRRAGCHRFNRPLFDLARVCLTRR